MKSIERKLESLFEADIKKYNTIEKYEKHLDDLVLFMVIYIVSIITLLEM